MDIGKEKPKVIVPAPPDLPFTPRMDALVIYPGLLAHRVRLEPGYEALTAIVGGYIEALPVRGHEQRATMYGNEEAKLVNRELEDGSWVTGMAPNSIATSLVYGPGDTAARKQRVEEGLQRYRDKGFEVIDASAESSNQELEPYVAGPVVVTGFDPKTGDNRDLPADIAQTILEMKVEWSSP